MKTRHPIVLALVLTATALAAPKPTKRWEDTAPPAEVLAKLEAQPSTPDAARCLQSVIRRARGADAQALQSRAFEQLLKHHARSPVLAQVVRRLEHGDRETAVPRLKRILTSSTSDEILGAAYIALARVTMNEPLPPGRPLPPEREAEAAKLLETAIARHGTAPYHSATVADQARGSLFELAHLMPGKLAPDIAGKDLDGRPMKLSEFRGRVVAISFWGDW